MIRNATQPVFHKGNLLKRKKNQKRKTTNGLWKMPQLWTSANQAVAFGSFCLMRMSTATWKSLAKTLGFPTFTTGLVIAMQYDHDIHTKNYKGWMRQRRRRGGAKREPDRAKPQ
jgi:hypothetical protein